MAANDNAPKSINPIEGIDPRIEQLKESKEILLANAVMLGEIPAPTFAEEDRIQFLANRFTEEGLQNISIDEAGNAMGILPGQKGDHTILVVAHADTPFDAASDHAMFVTENRIIGPGIADNSLGLAAMASLPPILDRLDLKFDDDLLLLGVSKSLGQGDLEGLRFFLDNQPRSIVGLVLVTLIHVDPAGAYWGLSRLRPALREGIPFPTYRYSSSSRPPPSWHGSPSLSRGLFQRCHQRSRILPCLAAPLLVPVTLLLLLALLGRCC